MYEAINKELGIKACSIGDLTMREMDGMLKQWNDGSSISTLTLFYDYKEDAIVLNRDNKNYDIYREFAERYLMCTEEEREEFRSKFMEPVGNAMMENIRVLENAISCRRNARDLFLLSNQPAMDERYDIQNSLLDAIEREYGFLSNHFLMFKAFQYGVMQGKRIERQKRKRQSVNA